MLISIAIPCYRSEKNLVPVVEEIKREFAAREGYDYQIILVNDGSPDHTEDVIRRLCQDDPKIVGILLSRNFTQANARMAALPYVKGDALIYMDDDGQHPPEGIFLLAEKIREGYDAAYAVFTTKKQSFFKIWTSDLNGKIKEALGTRPKGIKSSSFMAYSPFAVAELMKYDSPSPSPMGYLNSVTSKFANVPMAQRARISGKSGYTLKKLFALAITGYTNFTIIPLRIADVTGGLCAAAGFVYALALIIRRLFFTKTLPGYTSTTALVLILGGMILLALGMLGEYVGRIYIILSKKPQYIIRQLLNEPEEPSSAENSSK